MFKLGRTTIVGARSAQPSTAIYVEVDKQIYQHIRDNRRINIYEIAMMQAAKQ
jgi:hypothetical protein